MKMMPKHNRQPYHKYKKISGPPYLYDVNLTACVCEDGLY